VPKGRKWVVHRQGKRDAHGGAETGLPSHDLYRIELGERARQRIVE
jgi:hypothetical protein